MGGISLNRFHTTAMCSPTRASTLTGRNHHRVGAGQFANDWDGYSGHIPRSSALAAEVLKDYGYSTAALVAQRSGTTTAAGPFENWPTGLGFEYFYGLLAGEASQYEPNLVRDTTVVLHPRARRKLSPEPGLGGRRHQVAGHAATRPKAPRPFRISMFIKTRNGKGAPFPMCRWLCSNSCHGTESSDRAGCQYLAGFARGFDSGPD